MNGLYSYMTESEYNNYKEQILIESKLVKFDTISEINRLQYEQKIRDIDTMAVLENFDSSRLQREYEKAYNLYTEAEKSLWQSIKEYFIRLINAIFGRGLTDKQLKEIAGVKEKKSVAAIKTMLSYGDKILTTAENGIYQIARTIVVGSAVSTISGLLVGTIVKSAKNLIDKVKELKKEEEVDGEGCKSLSEQSVGFFNKAKGLFKKMDSPEIQEALDKDVEVNENGSKKKVKFSIIVKNTIDYVIKFFNDCFEKVTGIGKAFLKLFKKQEEKKDDNETKEESHEEWYKKTSGENILKGEMERWEKANGKDKDKAYWFHYHKTVMDLKRDNKFNETDFKKHMEKIEKSGHMENINGTINELKKAAKPNSEQEKTDVKKESVKSISTKDLLGMALIQENYMNDFDEYNDIKDLVDSI